MVDRGEVSCVSEAARYRQAWGDRRARIFLLLLLIAGFVTRVAAFGISAIMLGVVLTTHASVGFFMNWYGSRPGEGYEYHLFALALSG